MTVRPANVKCGTCSMFDTTDNTCHVNPPVMLPNGRTYFPQPPDGVDDWCRFWHSPEQGEFLWIGIRPQ